MAEKFGVEWLKSSEWNGRKVRNDLCMSLNNAILAQKLDYEKGTSSDIISPSASTLGTMLMSLERMSRHSAAM